MARIALIAGMAAAGAVLSVMTGGLGAFAVGAWIPDIMAGLAAGAAVGETIGSLVFQPRTNGPRLSDQQISNSANGSPIPFVFGGSRVAAQIIWSGGIVETATNQSQSSGKGIGSPSTLVYTYTISFAAAFCEGVANITRIWGDSKLIFDSTSKGAVSSDSFDTGLQNTGKQGGAQTTVVVPIIYTGTSDQMPDPTIQAAEGIDQTSAFRDICYIVYNDFPLADFGNRLPNIRGELSTGTTASFVKDIYPPINLDVPTQGGMGGTSIYNPTWCYVDPIGRAAFIVDQVGATAERIDLATTNTEPLESWQASTVYALGDQILDSSGNVETATQITGDGKSGATEPVWTPGGETFITTDHHVHWTNTGAGPEAILVTAKGILNPFLAKNESLVSQNYANNLPLAAAMDTRGYFWANYQITNGGPGVWYAVQFDASTFQAIARVPTTAPGFAMATAQVKGQDIVVVNTAGNVLGGGMCFYIKAKGAEVLTSASWIPSTDSSSKQGPVFPAIDPATGTVYVVTNPGLGSPYEWNITVLDPRTGTFETSAFQFHGDATHGQGVSSIFDSIDQTLIVFTDNGSLYKVRISDMTIVASAASVVSTASGLFFSKWNGGAVASVGLFIAEDSSNNLLYIDHATLTASQTTPIASWFAASLGGGFQDAQIDPITLSLICTPIDESGNYATFAFRIYLNRQQVPGETLDEIVSSICLRAGLTTDLIDVTALEDITVLGYPVTRNGDAKSCLIPLSAAFFFDAVESDFVLKFVPRGGASVMTIPEDDLGVKADGFELQQTIAQEHDLPKTIEVMYADPSLDYQTGKQHASRPARVVKSITKSVLELPITMAGDTAAQIAQTTIRTIWNERNQYASKLVSPKYMVLDATDIVELTYEDNLYVTRLTKNTIGQDFVTEFAGVSEDPKGYIATATANQGSGFPPQTLNPAAPTAFDLMDLPLLADTDNPPAGTSGYYYDLRSAAPGWPGGVLYSSPDNQNFTQVGFSGTAIMYGAVGAATPAPVGSPWTLDRNTAINVRVFGGGVLSSTSLLNLFNGANPFIQGDELMQFQTATLQVDGSYTLTNLLRGRRGTEWACGLHVTGEVALFLPTGLKRNNVPASLIGLAQYYEAATAGQVRNLASSQEITLQGNDLKPYSPVSIFGARDGSNNLTITWLRRTRIGGEQDWLDGVADVPLSETSEAYSVDVLVSGTVVRTFNGLTSPTVVYSAANQTTDGITPGNPVSVNIYQLSSVVGRGFPGARTV